MRGRRASDRPDATHRRPLLLESLEPRILLSTAGLGWTASPLALNSAGAESLTSRMGSLSVSSSGQVEEGLLSATVSCEGFDLIASDDGELISADGFSLSGDAGNPALPVAMIRIGLPSDADLSSVTLSVLGATTIALDGAHDILPAVPAAADNGDQTVVDWGAGKVIVDGRNELVYGQDALYGDPLITLIDVQQMRKWKVAEVEYSPFQYNPVTGELLLSTDVQFSVSYATGSTLDAAVLADAGADATADQMLCDYALVAPSYAPAAPGGPASQGDPADYLIVTTSAIQSGASAALDAFVASKEALGYSVLVATESMWGGGTGDVAANNIRSYLAANYATFGIDDALLIGNPDPVVGDVPMKMMWSLGGGDTSGRSPTDYYYADLTSNWDADGDGYYGEWDDDIGAAPLPEVTVGRIPFYGSFADLDSILQKSVDYASSADVAWRQSVLMPMAISNYANEDGSGYPRVDGHELAQYEISDITDPAGWPHYTLFEQSGLDPTTEPSDAALTEANFISAWQDGYGVVTWWAHGSATSASRKYWGSDDGDGVPEAGEMVWPNMMSSADAPSLDDSHPSFVIQVSCTNGNPESSDNLGYALLANGAIATVSASRVSWYAVASWTPDFAGSMGDNASYAYYGLQQAAGGATFGEALAWCRENFWLGWPDGQSWMNMTDFNLYGDPSLSLRVGSEVRDDPGDTIPGALDTGLDGSTQTVSYQYQIGDGQYGPQDVDLYKLSLNDPGDVLTADIDAQSVGSTLDSILRLFDANGNQIAFNDDWDGLDSHIEYTAPAPGTYYVGVSGYSNFGYDPLTGGSGIPGSLGTYALTLAVQGADVSAEIHGTKWNDLNADGVRETTEPGLGGWTIYLDLNNSGTLDEGEPSTLTDADGNYAFTGLAAGTYTVAEVPQAGWGQTSPAESQARRLFAVLDDGSDDIVELDSTTGAELNRFAAPEPVSARAAGLAFDGISLYFIDGSGSRTLYELDPDTGAVVASYAVTAGDGLYDGLAYLRGKVYISDYGNSDIIEFDPATGTVTNVLDIDGINGISIVGGLSGITGPDALVATVATGSVPEIDPVTGRVVAIHGMSTGVVAGGVAVLDGYICGGPSSGSLGIEVMDRAHGAWRYFDLPYSVKALGGDDVPADVQLVRVADHTDATGVDFGDCAEVVVTFPDPGLEAAVRSAVGKPTGDIYQTDVLRLAYLRADGASIASLEGLQYCTNLESLEVQTTQVSDISPLADLTKLQVLWLMQNQISDISVLAGLTGLEQLRLSYNEITDIAPLASLTGLRSLWLSGNPIGSAGDLAGLTDMLDLSLDFAGISDLGPLAGMTKLVALVAGSNPISDLSPLAGMTEMDSLFLWYDQISDLSPLAGMTKLHLLFLEGNQISDISPLVSNPGVGADDTVWIGSNPLNVEAYASDIPTLQARGAAVTYDAPATAGGKVWNDQNGDGDDPGEPLLSGWTVYVDLDGSGDCDAAKDYATTTAGDGTYSLPYLAPGYSYTVREVLPTGWIQTYPPGGTWTLTPAPGATVNYADFGNRQAQVVSFADANLEAVVREAIGKPTGDIYDSDLVGLTALVAFSRGIAGLAGLEHCTDLQTLDLSGNQISDISPVAELTNLSVLYLGSNQISSISALAGLSNLSVLGLPSNGVSDISPVAGLANLSALYLDSNQINNISSLAGLTNLQTLYLDGNQISNISSLAALTNLQALYVDDNQISDIEAAAGLPSLQDLHLDNNQISNISPLAGMTQLYALSLSNNQIGDLSAIAGLTGLWLLNLDGNQIGDIGPLVANQGLGAGDLVRLGSNPLDVEAYASDIPTLQGRSVVVGYDAAATVQGTVWNDQDGQGDKDAEEPGLSGWTVYVDLDGSGDYNAAADYGTTTASDGTYSLPYLAPGYSYTVREVAKIGWTQTAPAAGAYSLTPAIGATVTGINFGDLKTDTTPPQILSWASAHTHGTLGEGLLTLADDGSFAESRYDGISRLEVTFSEAIDPATFTPSAVVMAGNDVANSPVDLSGIDISMSLTTGGTVGIIDFSTALPDYARYAVRLDGIQDLAGNALSGDHDRIMTSLIGDIDGNLRVNNSDMAWVRYYRDLPANPVDLSDPYQLRTDVWPDGRVNNSDMAWIRYYRDEGRDARGILDPVLPGDSGSIGGKGGGGTGVHGVGVLHGNGGDTASAQSVSLGRSGALTVPEMTAESLLVQPLGKASHKALIGVAVT